MLGGGVSHPSQLTTGLVIKSVTTSPTLAGERMLFILQVSILSEQILIFVSVKEKPNRPPNVNKTSSEGQSTERERCSLNGG